jgi:hypothetical protein
MNMNCRKSVKDLTVAEKSEYVQAIITLKNSPSIISAAQAVGAASRYDDYVWIHLRVMGGADIDLGTVASDGKTRINANDLAVIVNRAYSGAFVFNEGDHYHIHFEDCT